MIDSYRPFGTLQLNRADKRHKLLDIPAEQALLGNGPEFVQTLEGMPNDSKNNQGGSYLLPHVCS